MKVLALFVLIAIAIVSCEKELSSEPPANPGTGNNPPPPTSDSTLLWKYIEVDTTLPAGSDTTFVEIYTYDGQKRLSHFYVGFLGTEQNADLFYSGNDTLPYKINSFLKDFIDTYRDTIFYSFSNGWVTKDSMIRYDGITNQFSQIRTQVYTPAGHNTLFEYRHYSSLPAVAPDEDKRSMIFTTFQNGNITVQDDTTAVDLISSAAHEEVKYDDKINPLYESYPVRLPVLIYSHREQQNNVVDYNRVDRFSQPWHLTYSYTYRADGRPSVVKIFDQTRGTYAKGIFLYTK
jgi:hypothetical protein